MARLAVVVTAAMLLVALASKHACADEPVRVEYYMEALCPYCANFTLETLAPLMEGPIGRHVQLSFVPWGNARSPGKAVAPPGRQLLLRPSDGSVDPQPEPQPQCQHGPLECELNRLLSCATALCPDQHDSLRFLVCLEDLVVHHQDEDDVAVVAARCAPRAGLRSDALLRCHRGKLGATLQRLAAERTAALQPPHEYVPWVVVNGVPLLGDDANLARYVCVAYRGRDRAAECLHLPDVSKPNAAMLLHSHRSPPLSLMATV